MPSMSYCMFENTESELQQCVDAMNGASSLDELDLNSHEREAFMRMWNLCREFLAEHERLLNTADSEELENA